MISTPEAARERIADHFRPDPPKVLGVAVSGGSDSLALLVLLTEWHRQGGPAVSAVTVDHGLRPESAAEAAEVSAICARLGVAHSTVHWQGWNGQGNLPDRARRARYGLLADWAGRAGVGDIAVGHTADDQAETFLMRLAREAGLDGLSAMADRWRQEGVTFHRPALTVTRAALRDELRARGVAWIEDPTNADPAFERVRARQVLSALAPLGISADGLASVAHNLRDARDTLYHYVARAARDNVAVMDGDLLLDRGGLTDLPAEIARRLLRRCLQWVGGAAYGPRGAAMEAFRKAAAQGRTTTLQGCLLVPEGDRLRLVREYNAVRDLRVPADAVWDGRWRLTGPEPEGAEIGALGPEGLAVCPDWRATGRPRVSLLSSPAVWKGTDLLAAPLAGVGNGWRADLLRDEASLTATGIAH